MDSFSVWFPCDFPSFTFPVSLAYSSFSFSSSVTFLFALCTCWDTFHTKKNNTRKIEGKNDPSPSQHVLLPGCRPPYLLGNIQKNGQNLPDSTTAYNLCARSAFLYYREIFPSYFQRSASCYHLQIECLIQKSENCRHDYAFWSRVMKLFVLVIYPFLDVLQLIWF